MTPEERDALTWRADGMRSPYDAGVRKGAEAREAGIPRTSNPYHESHATNRFGIAVARAWRNAWFKGWDGRAALRAEAGA